MGFINRAMRLGGALRFYPGGRLYPTHQRTLRGESMFAIGSLPALLIFFIRRNVNEPQLAVAARKSGPPYPSSRIFDLTNLRATIVGSLLTIGAQGGFTR